MGKNELTIAWILIFYCIYSLVYYLLLLIVPGEAYRFYIVADASRHYTSMVDTMTVCRIYRLFNYGFIAIMIWRIWHVRSKTV